MASCAQDGFDDEEFDSGVYNTQLEAPSADDIKITPSTDGAMQTISWPLVYGAGGYHAILTDTDNGEVVKDTLIDGVSFATKRAEDTNYKISLAVLDNKEKNNKGTEPVERYSTPSLLHSRPFRQEQTSTSISMTMQCPRMARPRCSATTWSRVQNTHCRAT